MGASLFHIDLARTPQAVVHAGKVMTEAALWLVEKGIPLWDPNDFQPANLMEHAAAGELVLMQDDEGAPAAAMLRHWRDLDFWPDYPDDEATFLHKIAVARHYASQGLTDRLVAWAVDDARRAGRRFVRLDCEARPKLVGIYLRLGFEEVDRRLLTNASATVAPGGIFALARFEKRV